MGCYVQGELVQGLIAAISDRDPNAQPIMQVLETYGLSREESTGAVEDVNLMVAPNLNLRLSTLNQL